MQLTVAGDRVFFSADDGVRGAELWVTDGTEAGTQMVMDINPVGSSNPMRFTRLGNRIVFAADDGKNGNEVWVSDGTPAGTQLLKDVNAGAENSSPLELVAAGGSLFFTAIADLDEADRDRPHATLDHRRDRSGHEARVGGAGSIARLFDSELDAARTPAAVQCPDSGRRGRPRRQHRALSPRRGHRERSRSRGFDHIPIARDNANRLRSKADESSCRHRHRRRTIDDDQRLPGCGTTGSPRPGQSGVPRRGGGLSTDRQHHEHAEQDQRAEEIRRGGLVEQRQPSPAEDAAAGSSPARRWPADRSESSACRRGPADEPAGRRGRPRERTAPRSSDAGYGARRARCRSGRLRTPATDHWIVIVTPQRGERGHAESDKTHQPDGVDHRRWQIGHARFEMETSACPAVRWRTSTPRSE